MPPDQDASERAAAYWRALAKSADQNRPGTEVIVLQGTPRERQAAEQDAIVEGNRPGLAMQGSPHGLLKTTR
jgi:hypothetical protein